MQEKRAAVTVLEVGRAETEGLVIETGAVAGTTNRPAGPAVDNLHAV